MLLRPHDQPGRESILHFRPRLYEAIWIPASLTRMHTKPSIIISGRLRLPKAVS